MFYTYIHCLDSASLVSPCVPEPEAKIESDACRENLIENISHYQKLINDRMDRMEEQIKSKCLNFMKDVYVIFY